MFVDGPTFYNDYIKCIIYILYFEFCKQQVWHKITVFYQNFEVNKSNQLIDESCKWLCC